MRLIICIILMPLITLGQSGIALQESGDAAWARLEKMGGQIPAGKEAYQEYLQLRPLGKKRYEDQHLLTRMQLAEAFWQSYPLHSRRQDALRMFLSANPYFIAASGNESLDTIEKQPGMDWAAILRSAVIDTAARQKWLTTGNRIVFSILNGAGTKEEKEKAAFSLFARDFRLASGNFGLLPRKEAEADYWSAFEQVYWKSFLQRFREHMQQFAELAVLPERAKDFLSALKGYSPAVAAIFWNELQKETSKANQDGLKLLYQTATEQLMALKLERGEEALKMSFTALDKTEFQLEKLRGKVVLIDFWASWCKPCLNEFPHLRTMLEKYNRDGFEIAGICLDNESALPRVKEIIQENKITWPQRFEGKGFHSDTYRLLYGINSLPTVWLLDKSGRIVSTDARGAKLEPLIQKYLNEK
ncbi:TlpA family protein disulfide reductase [Pseudobacter ginsenosidimutans]|uniref:Thiol-disulfide isomerase/thioredoxin n=1 Tax=Pseudobacter ginsenosidimutans TaxID=661488 RepID=A0A4Q7N3V4_9BACT|nr:TlpA disulfide reductase family protein [Pseudobacter ginsenosidimutans]QEC44204.1 TlpA family protein disulfide reductase [Pseudobacter ginsenosidimutans]RZS75661.1 thiol-disulfide isomerase/thioredoxin [Pseudobacter ginsenosidimutans]